MKFALTAIALGFLVLSCKKESNVSTDSTSDSTVVNNNDTMQNVIPPASATDSTMVPDSIPANRTDTAVTAKTSR